MEGVTTKDGRWLQDSEVLEIFGERAAVFEYEAGFARAEAERMAHAEIVAQLGTSAGSICRFGSLAAASQFETERKSRKKATP